MEILNLTKEIESYVNEFDLSNEEVDILEDISLKGDDYLDHLDRVLVWKGSHGDMKARELFILGKISYVKKIVKADKEVIIYKNKGLDEEDLFQTGIIGVMETIEKYDFRIDVKVRTFLACRVRFAIKNAYRCYGMISVSREANSIYAKFSRKFSDIPDKISEKTLNAMSNEIGIDSKKIMDAILAIKSNNSLFSYDNEGYIELDNKSRDKSSSAIVRDFNEEMDRIFDYKVVINSFSILSEKERYIMEEIYIKDKTQKIIAKKLGCSATTIGKIRKNAILKIRKKVQDYSWMYKNYK